MARRPTAGHEAERAWRPRLIGGQHARTDGLRAEVSLALTRQGPLRALLQRCAAAMVNHLGAAFARIWTLDPDEDVLRLQASAGLYTHLDGPHGCVRVGQLKIGRIAQERRPHLTNNVARDPRIGDKAWARAEGMVAFAGYPLVVESRLVGVMAMFARHRLPPDTLDAIAAIADPIAQGIERKRTEEALRESQAKLQRESERLLALHHASTMLATHAADPDTVLDEVLRSAVALLGADAASLYRWDADAQFLRRVRDWAVPTRGITRDMQPHEGIVGQTFTRAEPVIVNDYQGWEHAIDPGRPGQLRSGLGVPLRRAGRPVGVLLIRGYRDDLPPFTDDDARIVSLFGDQAIAAIETADTLRREQERRRQLEAVRDVMVELTRELDLTKLLGLIVARAADLVGTVDGIVYLWDQVEERLLPSTWIGIGDWITDFPLALGEGVVGTVAARREGMVVNDYPGSPHARRAVLDHLDVPAVIAEPIVYQDRLLGVIALSARDEGRAFTAGDLQLLSLFAGQVAIAMENARLFEEAAHVEAMRALDRLKTEFVSTISHELRTPLSLLHGYAELIMLRGASWSQETLVDVAREMYASSRTMTRLVDDLLDFARLERGELALTRRRTQIEPILVPLVESFRRQPGGDRIAYQVEPGLEGFVDPDRLAQIVANLLANALRYAPTGPIVVAAWRDSDQLRLEVADRGPGIPRAARERVWERFYRGANQMSSPIRGSGVGLAVVKQLVELHHGQVGLRTSARRGTTFWLTIPDG